MYWILPGVYVSGGLHNAYTANRDRVLRRFRVSPPPRGRRAYTYFTAAAADARAVRTPRIRGLKTRHNDGGKSFCLREITPNVLLDVTLYLFIFLFFFLFSLIPRRSELILNILLPPAAAVTSENARARARYSATRLVLFANAFK